MRSYPAPLRFTPDFSVVNRRGKGLVRAEDLRRAREMKKRLKSRPGIPILYSQAVDRITSPRNCRNLTFSRGAPSTRASRVSVTKAWDMFYLWWTWISISALFLPLRLACLSPSLLSVLTNFVFGSRNAPQGRLSFGC